MNRTLYRGSCLTLLVVLCLSQLAVSQSKRSLAERLGYPASTKLLLVHADDLGAGYAVNQASFKALEQGSVSSASIMMPCPWIKEVAEYAKTKPDSDLGLHLTLTSEWQWYKWGSVASRSLVSSLVDPVTGYLYDNCDTMV